MSVVNKMLQDLEARKAQPDTSAEYQAPEKAKSKLLLPLLTMTLLAIVAWLLYSQLLATTEQPSLINTKQNSLHSTDVSTSDMTVQQQGLPNSSSVANKQSQSESESADNHIPKSNQSESGILANQTSIETFSEGVSAANADPQTEQSKEVETELAAQLPESIPVAVPASSFVKVKNTTDPANKAVADSPTGGQNISVKSAPIVETEEDIRRQVQIALKRNDDVAAIDLLKKLVVVAPNNDAARKRLAAMLFSKGEHGQADKVLNQGIEIQPDNIELRMMQAKLYVQLQQPEKAHDLLNRYKTNQSQALLSYRAALAQQLERFDFAQQDYQQLTRNQPANAKWWLGLAIANERLNNTQQALLAYQSAKRLSQLSVEVDTFVEQRIQYLAGVN